MKLNCYLGRNELMVEVVIVVVVGIIDSELRLLIVLEGSRLNLRVAYVEYQIDARRCCSPRAEQAKFREGYGERLELLKLNWGRGDLCCSDLNSL